uniref:Uncharacterized protein n=1 Tax=Desulfovibrio sp. U5L TaxID=596152 RepID=I2Q3P8_9BACT
MSPGRPRKTRIPGSGDKLRRALEILGLSWGKRHAAARHVLRDGRWAECGLPKSVNTIAEDIRLGLPLGRLAGYAAFLNIPIGLLQDEAVPAHSAPFAQAVFAAREEAAALNLPFVKSFDKSFCRHLYACNPQTYINALFGLLRGVYALRAVFPPSREIHNGCALVHAAEDHCLRAEAFMPFRHTDIRFEATIFRWGGNLHLSYYSRDLYTFGRLLTEDPLRHFAVANRRPFHLALAGVADSLIESRTFDIVRCLAKRLDDGPETDLTDRYAAACREARLRPTVFPADPDHARLLDQVLAARPSGGVR